MSLYESFKGFGRNVLLGGTLLGGLCFGMKDAKAEDVKKPITNPISVSRTLDDTVEKKPFPHKRTIMLDFENPQDSYDANAKLWFSLNQLIGKGDDFAGYTGLDDKLVGRFLSLSLCSYFAGALYFYSHEMAHNYEDRRYGEKHNPHFDFSNWWSGVYPNFVQYPFKDSWDKFSEDSFIRTVVDGLNQDEHNIQTVWKNNLLEKKWDYYNSVAFLVAKLGYLEYMLSVGFKEDHPEKTGLSVRRLYEFYQQNPKLVNDIDQYTQLLRNKGIKLSKEAYFIQALIADIASWQTLDSFLSVWQYLENGKRVHKPVSLNFGKNIKLTPPLINCYLTPKGTFYNINCFLSSDKNAFEFSLGHDVDFIGDGKVNHLRAGGKFYSQTLFKAIKARPFVYLNFSRINPSYKGISAGLEIVFLTPIGIDIKGKIEYNQNDLLENTIKGKNKVEFSSGVEFKF